MTKEEKIKMYLEWQSQDNKVSDIDNTLANKIGYSTKDNLLKALRRTSYISYDKETDTFMYNNCNTDVVQSCNTDVVQENNKDITLVKQIQLMDMRLRELESLLHGEKEEYIKLTIDRDDKAIQTNYRVYENVRDRFKEFCKKNKEYKVQELISQALNDFMDKYN